MNNHNGQMELLMMRSRFQINKVMETTKVKIMGVYGNDFMSLVIFIGRNNNDLCFIS